MNELSNQLKASQNEATAIREQKTTLENEIAELNSQILEAEESKEQATNIEIENLNAEKLSLKE